MKGMMYNKISTIIDGLDIKPDNSKTLIEQLHAIMQEYLARTDVDKRLDTRIYQHTMRTMKYADRLLKKVKADREIVMSALLLHDIGKTITEKRHDLVSYSLAREILSKLNVEESKKNKILDCVLYHSSKDMSCIEFNEEQKVINDADLLDEIGILTITKYCGAKVRNRNIDVELIVKGLEEKYREIDEETRLLKTKCGEELYIRKKKFLRQIIDDFKMEISMFNIK